MQISTKATKQNKNRKRMSYHQQQTAKQVDQRGKLWQRTDKRDQWQTVDI